MLLRLLRAWPAFIVLAVAVDSSDEPESVARDIKIESKAKATARVAPASGRPLIPTRRWESPDQ